MPALPRESPWREFARAPLVPSAVAVAVGLALGRALMVPVTVALVVALAAILAYFFTRSRLLLPLAFAALAAAHLQAHCHVFADDDIGHFATDTPRIVRLRGILEDEPVVRKADRSELFGPARRIDRATTVLGVTEIAQASEWQPASGRTRVIIERIIAVEDGGSLDSLSIGDEVETVGLLLKPLAPSNPGEIDFAARLLDHRIRCELRITKVAKGVTRLAAGDWSWSRFLAGLRSRITNILKETTPASDIPLARALLLGDTTATERDDWDAFARTGVLHVLAISGQHLVILAGFAWIVLRFLGVPRRRGAWLVLVLIVTYAALTGGRPSAVRAAVMVGIVCGGVIARRPVSAANAFALAWLVVVAINPAEAISYGSLLSFLSVFVLVWGAFRWLEPAERTTVQQLLHEARPAWLNALRSFGRGMVMLYAVNLILTVANSPMIIARQNVAPPVGLLIGPPMVVLTTIALISGFVQMLLGLFSPFVALPFGAVTSGCLSLAKSLVLQADQMPGGSVFLPDLSLWWVAGFYAILVLFVLAPSKYGILALLTWILLGVVSTGSGTSAEMRITFLSIGHGGCTVVETPDGRVLVYDVGSMAGPDTVKRVIAPYLWHRGIRRIDELFLSHADLDHYNGVLEVLRRFPVGQATMTPSFALKPVPEVAQVMQALQGVPKRIAVAGETFSAGEVAIEVLHPPLEGPAGSENERSLVLLVAHRGHTILLTGDLEKTGTTMLLAGTPRPVDVLMAPHHGSPAAFPTALAAWAAPKLVVVSRGPRTGNLTAIPVAWDTWHQGAITIRSHATGLTAEAFRTRERRVVTRGP